jgi:peroxiredoxin
MKAGTRYTIDLTAKGIDAYLRLLDPKGKQLDEDDDSGGDLNSRIVFNCPADGDYRIVCTTFGPDMYAPYMLTVKAAGGVPKPSSAHSTMVGKPAPEFKSDFAINGNPSRIADFKDKVVLLYFWEARNAASTELLGKLAEWHKAHKGDGLAIVGLTYYLSDIGSKVEFDKESGEVKTAKKADRVSDQALLTAYAKHHKIEHLLLALPKQDALDAFDAYVVNGVPQMVLIDRKGMVRLIEVRAEKGVDNVHAELKKLLAEK